MVCIVLIVCIGFWKTLDSLDCLYCFLDWVGWTVCSVLIVDLFGMLDSLGLCVLLLGFGWSVLIVWIGYAMRGQSCLFILFLGFVWAVWVVCVVLIDIFVGLSLLVFLVF